MDLPSLQVGLSAALGAPQTLPLNFCDWDFCPSFLNYRDVHKQLLDNPTKWASRLLLSQCHAVVVVKRQNATRVARGGGVAFSSGEGRCCGAQPSSDRAQAARQPSPVARRGGRWSLFSSRRAQSARLTRCALARCRALSRGPTRGVRV